MTSISPIQVYVSAFPFLPCQSALRREYQDSIRPDLNITRVTLGLDETWDPKLRMLAPETGVHCITVSSDGVLLATTHYEANTLSLWNLKSGHRVSRLESDVLSSEMGEIAMVFLPDNRLLGCYPSEKCLWAVDADFSHVESVSIDEVESLDWER